MTSITHKLQQNTGYSWEEINDLYLKFQLKHSRNSQMCVFTPDDIKRQRMRLYQPANSKGLDVHDPDIFLRKYLNAKNIIVKNMPWVKFDLDQFPAVISSIVMLARGRFLQVNYTLKLAGDVKLRPRKSQNDKSIGSSSLKNIAANASLAFGEYIDTFKTNFDFESRKFSLGYSTHDDLGTTSLTLTGNTFEGEYTPSANVKRTNFLGWEMEMQLGYNIEGEFQFIDNDLAPNTTSSHSMVKEIVKYGLIPLGIVALIVFTDGLAAPLVVAV